MMLSRLVSRRFASNLTKVPASNVPLRLYRWLDVYEDFVGLKEVKQAQTAVNDAEQIFINSQSERRAYSDRLMKIQSDLTSIRLEMEKFSRSDDRYLELFQKEHNLIKEEKLVQHQLKQHENQERQLLASFQLALRQSQEKEKMRVERTKYWSLIGSIVGTLLGIIGATISNRYRMQEFHHLHEESRKLVDDQVKEQEAKVQELKEQIRQSLASQNNSILVPVFDEQAQEKLQSEIISRMNILVISTTCLSLLISFWLHQR